MCVSALSLVLNESLGVRGQFSHNNGQRREMKM